MSATDYSDLSAVYINCTLKRSPEPSNTRALADRSIRILEENGVRVEVIRAIDHDIATGVYPDMTEHAKPGRPTVLPKPPVRGSIQDGDSLQCFRTRLIATTLARNGSAK